MFQFSEDQFDEYRDLVLEDKKRVFRLAQIENEGNDPAKTGKSYGTPHDLASLYGKGRMGQGTQNASNLPSGYDEKRAVGRPEEKSSIVNTQQDPLGKDYGFSLLDGKINYTYNLAVTWKGDVNLSHSATPPSNGITTMSANFGERRFTINGEPTAYIISQIVGDSLLATIKFNPNINSIVGTQFQINYDNSLITLSSTKYKTTGSPINFANDRGTFINLGSLNTGGELLDGTTEYQLTFKLKQQLDNSLGLVSIAGNEAVNKDGKTIKIRIQ